MYTFDPDRHYLVLTQKAGSSLRSLCNYRAAKEQQLRNMLVPALKHGIVVAEYEDTKGRGRAVEMECESYWNYGTTFRATIMFGVDMQGKPKMSPDGKKQCVFLVGVE